MCNETSKISTALMLIEAVAAAPSESQARTNALTRLRNFVAKDQQLSAIYNSARIVKA